MGYALLRRQFNGDDGDDLDDGWGYSNVSNKPLVSIVSSIKTFVDSYRHQVGFRWGNHIDIPSLVCRRLLSCATQNKERLAAFGLPQSMTMTSDKKSIC